MKKIEELLAGQNGHYLYPFFWQKGQSPEIIRDYIQKMYEQGIYHFCVESRPHPDFLEQGWWDTMDVIIDEAKSRGMQIWILDDAKFPTGCANGKVPRELQKRYLACHRYDVCGGSGEIELNISNPTGIKGMMDDHSADTLLCVLLCQNDISTRAGILEGTQQDVTDQVEDGILYLNLPDENYSVFVLYETSVGQEKSTSQYLDPMRAEATQILLDEVYQKHYEHYAAEFGRTIQGFFSDEPRFGSSPNRTDRIGDPKLALPWNETVWKKLQEAGISSPQLSYLFSGEPTKEAGEVRFAYMDTVSRLYSENFSMVLGEWCHAHGVAYVGHVIEDDNAHARIGQGPGHYFRAMAGQDVAGIDVIGGQIVPGMGYFHDSFMSSGSDGEFYHYALERMAASCAKLDPRKKGNVMCEAYGAYGWVEGLKMMKWITDHLISHGVNCIVPHAFDPAPFPDWDCPPHFYAHGNNPQYPYFKVFTAYTDRLCHLFRGGAQQASVGILYHASGEWSGETVMIQSICRVLEQNQIDSNIISEDALAECTLSEDGYTINGFTYPVLLVPGCTHLPKALLGQLARIAQVCPVYWVGNAPEESSSPAVVREDELPLLLSQYQTVQTDTKVPHLNVYHYTHEDGDVLMLMNTHVCKRIDCRITVPGSKNWCIYDAMENTLYSLEAQQSEKGTSFSLNLEAYESLILVEGSCSARKPARGKELLCISDNLSVAMKSYQEKEFAPVPITSIGNLAKKYPRFSGSVSYRFTAKLEQTNVLLELTGAEVISAAVNGVPCGTCIAPPYRFDVSAQVHPGENDFTVTVVNTLTRALRDPFSMYIPTEAYGLTGEIRLYEKR